MVHGPVLEGVFAIEKPSGITSGKLIRKIQDTFTRSKLFQPLINRERERLAAESHNQKQKRNSFKRKLAEQVKVGHGGTLDPMAAGVLIVGIGKGTKTLNRFLECSKTYETVVLFGATSDTYDTTGKLADLFPYMHITREKVEEALMTFHGTIMQIPPKYSALKIDGKPSYWYARNEKQLPREMKGREVRVEKIELMEWIEGGTHVWKWPSQEGNPQTLDTAEHDEDVSDIASEDVDAAGSSEPTMPQRSRTKRKRNVVVSQTNDDDDVEGPRDGLAPHPANGRPSSKRAKASPEPVGDNPIAAGAEIQPAQIVENGPHPTIDDEEIPDRKNDPCPAPAARIRMTVSSGFYVRSLAYDLGARLQSGAAMAELTRTRQGQFELGTNVLPLEDLDKGEAVWGPTVQSMLETWQVEGWGKSPPRSKQREEQLKNEQGKTTEQENEERRQHQNTSSEGED